MPSTSHSTMSFAISRLLLLLLLFFIHETQSYPKSIYFNCPEHAYSKGETSLAFPFTTSDLPDCGAWSIQMLTIVVASNPQDLDHEVPRNDSCLKSNAGFPSTQLVSFTNGTSLILEELETLIRCPYWEWDGSSKWDSKYYKVRENGDYTVYCPYEQDHLPGNPPPHQGCFNILVPNL